MKIKAIVISHSTKTDTNGNRYHLAHVTNTKNGKSMTVYSGSETNTAYAVCKALGGWDGVMHTEGETIGYREHQRITKGLPVDTDVNWKAFFGVK